MSRSGPGALRRWLQGLARQGSGDRRGGLTASSGPAVRIASFDRQAAQIVAMQGRTLGESRDRGLVRAYATLVEEAVVVDVGLGRALARRLPEVLALADDAVAYAFVAAISPAVAADPAAARWCVDHGATLVREVPASALRGFVAEGLGVWARDPVAGRAFLAGESAAARRRLGAAVGLDVAQIRGRLTDYAHTFGVDLEVVPLDAPWPARLSGRRLALPSPLRLHGDERDLDILRVVVARAATRLASGGLGCGLSDDEADLLDLLETRRADAALRRRLPGLGRAFHAVAAAPAVRDHALSRQPPALQVRRLLAAWALGLPAPPAASAEARGVFEALRGELDLLDAPGCTPHASARLARELAAVLGDLGPGGPRVAQVGEVLDEALRRPAEARAEEGAADEGGAADQAGDGEDAGAGDGPDEEGAGDGEDAGDGPDEEGAGDGGGDAAEAGGEGDPSRAAEGRAGGDDPDAVEAAAPVGAYAPDEGDEAVAAGRATAEVVATYPEWDPALRELRPDWAQVHERPVQTTDPGFADRTLEARAATIRELRRVFLALRTEGTRPSRRQLDGPELDLDAAVAESLDRRAGRLPVGRLYQRPHQRGRDVAVALLVDLSSSTREVLPAGMRIVDIEKEAVLCLGEALVAAGDRFAVLGFSGHGRDDVQVSVAKDFAEPWGPRARAGVGGLRPLLENRDGAAIRHATARLLAEDARTRLLVLLSDGRPLDCGDPAYHGEHARADTADALRQARASGVRPLCLTVAPEGTDALDALYGRGAYVIVRDPARLAEQVGHHYAAWAGP